jgi:hypothetical protein
MTNGHTEFGQVLGSIGQHGGGAVWRVGARKPVLSIGLLGWSRSLSTHGVWRDQTRWVKLLFAVKYADKAYPDFMYSTLR